MKFKVDCELGFIGPGTLASQLVTFKGVCRKDPGVNVDLGAFAGFIIFDSREGDWY